MIAPRTAGTGTIAMPGPTSAISLHGISRRYGDVVAVDDLDLDIPTGSTVALLGPNSAGKSTSISIMLGLLEPTSGEACTLGMPPVLDHGRLVADNLCRPPSRSSVRGTALKRHAWLVRRAGLDPNR